MALPASSSGLFRFLSPRLRPQPTDVAAAATWGVAAGSAAIYLVQFLFFSRKLAGFLVYNFLKSWNGERLPFINTISHSLRTEFSMDILKSSGNESI